MPDDPSATDHRYAPDRHFAGPYVLNLLDDSILMISADLREMALVIILIKAGLSLKLQDLKAVGRPA